MPSRTASESRTSVSVRSQAWTAVGVELDLERLLVLDVLVVDVRLVEAGVAERREHGLGVGDLGRRQRPLGEAAELGGLVGVVAVGVGQQPLEHGVVRRQRRTAAEPQLAGERIGIGRRLAVAVAQQLDHLAGEAGDDVRLAGLERGQEAAAAAALERFHCVGPLQRGPEPVLVHRLHVALHLLAAAAGHDGLALVVHGQHQLGGLLLGVAEVVAEHVRDVRHQVDRVVPDDRDPRVLELDDVVDVGLVDLHRGRRRRGHTSIVDQQGRRPNP